MLNKVIHDNMVGTSLDPSSNLLGIVRMSSSPSHLVASLLALWKMAIYYSLIVTTHHPIFHTSNYHTNYYQIHYYQTVTFIVTT